VSKQANPRLVGAFVVIGILLAVVTVTMIGSFRAFKARQTFVMYFSSSVNNLNVGAKVKWKGVPVGQVSDIRIRWNQDALSTEVPVFVEIDLGRLGMDLEDKKVLKQEIANGLRAQMQWDSLISGMLYIELNYVANPAPPDFYETEKIYPELPTIAAPFDAIGDIAFEIADNLRQIDFKSISDNLNASLEQLNHTLQDLDASGLSRSMKSAANSVTSLAGSPQVTEMIENASATLKSIQALSEKLGDVAGPLPEQIGALSDQLRSMLASIEQTSSMLSDTVSDNSRTMTSLNDAMRELAAAARSARELTSFLERNPNALIGGRSNPETDSK